MVVPPQQLQHIQQADGDALPAPDDGDPTPPGNDAPKDLAGSET